MRVFFSCLFCGALHSAVQVKRPVASNNRFDCQACKRSLHRWWTGYDFTDWMGPLDPGSTRRDRSAVQEKDGDHDHREDATCDD